MSAESATRADSVLSNLTSLGMALSLTLDSVRQQRDELLNADGEHLRQFEKDVTRIRVVVEQLEREFNLLEYLLNSRRVTSGSKPNSQRLL